MRVILSNEDAERLAQLLKPNPDAPISVEAREDVGEGGTLWVTIEGVEVRGKARRTPGKAGSVTIEDWDGRVVATWDSPT